MGLSYASNVASLHAQTQLKRHTDALSQTFERLSTGMRINNASDDPGGLALADVLGRDAALANVAIRNANDGISLVAVADAALQEIGSMLSRMSELATQSANGIYTNSQRSALSSEFLALGSEIERIAKTTTFNGIKLLSGSNSIALQVGLDGTTNSQITIQSVLGNLTNLGLAGAGSSSLTFSIIDLSTNGAAAAATVALSNINNAINSLSSFRGTLGAAESRLNHAVSSLTIARENFLAAESRIRDVDIAEESANLVKYTVLQQATQAVLAQANLQPEVALKLLQ